MGDEIYSACSESGRVLIFSKNTRVRLVTFGESVQGSH